MNGGFRKVGGTYRRNLKGDRWTMHRMEVYRLWVEFLRRCEKPNLKKYPGWGDYRNTPFKEWWRKKWVRLFAEPKGRKPVNGLTRSQAKFRVTEGVKLKVRSLRYYLKAYDLKQKGHKPVEIAELIWKEREEMRKRNPNRIIHRVHELDLRKPVNVKGVDLRKLPKGRRLGGALSDIYDPDASEQTSAAIRTVYRWIQRAKKIIANVEKGEFPGKV
jgi:hypothetical protein